MRFQSSNPIKRLFQAYNYGPLRAEGLVAGGDPRRAAHSNRCFNALYDSSYPQGRLASLRNVFSYETRAFEGIRPTKGIFDADLHFHVRKAALTCVHLPVIRREANCLKTMARGRR